LVSSGNRLKFATNTATQRHDGTRSAGILPAIFLATTDGETSVPLYVFATLNYFLDSWRNSLDGRKLRRTDRRCRLAFLGPRLEAWLLDLSMPGYSGFEVCQTLASLTLTQGIPIVIVTGKSGDEDKAFCENLGAKALFQKPVYIESLKKTLGQLVAGRKRDRPAEPRVHLKIALTLRGTDSNSRPFNLDVITENVSANDFLAACSTPLKEGGIVDVHSPSNGSKLVGKARVIRVDWPNTPSQRCDFHFTEKPTEWILR
jgi:CheY-like chemotaxis protein